MTLDLTNNFDATRLYLNVVTIYVRLMILLSRVEDRKAVLGLFNAAHEMIHGQVGTKKLNYFRLYPGDPEIVPEKYGIVIFRAVSEPSSSFWTLETEWRSEFLGLDLNETLRPSCHNLK